MNGPNISSHSKWEDICKGLTRSFAQKLHEEHPHTGREPNVHLQMRNNRKRITPHTRVSINRLNYTWNLIQLISTDEVTDIIKHVKQSTGGKQAISVTNNKDSGDAEALAWSRTSIRRNSPSTSYRKTATSSSVVCQRLDGLRAQLLDANLPDSLCKLLGSFLKDEQR